MRIAMLTFYPSDERIGAGGIRMVSYNLVQGLKAYPDLDLHVVHCHPDVSRDRIERDGNVTLHFLAMSRKRIVPNLVTRIGRVLKAIKVINPDLVHAHTADYVYAAARSGRPMIYTIYGVVHRERQIYTDTLFDRLRFWLLSYFESYSLPRASQLVASSPYALREYAHIKQVPWVCIENPMPQSFFELQDRAEEGRILSVASIDERKDVLTLLRAMERVRQANPQARLVIIGKVNSEAYDQRVRAFVAERHLEDCVQFLGYVDRQRVMDEYERCAVLALASREETAPMAILEAMAAAKPVVATRVGGVPDFVRDGETGLLVSPGDDEALAQRLDELLRQPELRRKMGQRGKEACRARFHVEQVARQYYELYQRVLAGSR